MFRLLAVVMSLISFYVLANNTQQPAIQKTLRVAIFLEPPFALKKDGQYIGEYPDIARLLAKSINYKIHWVECPVARCFALLKVGRADMIIGVKQTKPREQYLAYIQPAYFMQHVPINFFINSSKKVIINRYADLQQLNIGVLRGSSYFEPFDHDNSLHKTEVTTTTQLVKMLVKNRIDTFVEREESLSKLSSYQQHKDKLKTANFRIKLAMATFVAISKKSPIFKKKRILEHNLQKFLTSGEIDKLIIKPAKNLN